MDRSQFRDNKVLTYNKDIIRHVLRERVLCFMYDAGYDVVFEHPDVVHMRFGHLDDYDRVKRNSVVDIWFTKHGKLTIYFPKWNSSLKGQDYESFKKVIQKIKSSKKVYH